MIDRMPTLRSLLLSVVAVPLAVLPVPAAAEPVPATVPATSPAEPDVAAPESVRFDPAAPRQLEVVRAPTGHLLVKPTVNGQDVGWFIFDTGAGINCIDKGVAEKLALPDGGAITAAGMGGDQQTRLRMADSVALGPVSLGRGPMLELDLKAFQIFMGRPIAGVIGFEYFSAAVFEIDFESPTVTVHNPADYSLPAGNEWSELKLIRRRPYVPGSIEGNEPGLFVLDIGSNTPLIVHTPTVNRFKLLEGRETRTALSGGVGGMSKIARGTVRELSLCGRTIADVDTSFSQKETGATSLDEAQGTIGVGTLHGYRLIVDYQREKVALVPRS